MHKKERKEVQMSLSSSFSVGSCVSAASRNTPNMNKKHTSVCCQKSCASTSSLKKCLLVMPQWVEWACKSPAHSLQFHVVLMVVKLQPNNRRVGTNGSVRHPWNLNDPVLQTLKIETKQTAAEWDSVALELADRILLLLLRMGPTEVSCAVHMDFTPKLSSILRLIIRLLSQQTAKMELIKPSFPSILSWLYECNSGVLQCAGNDSKKEAKHLKTPKGFINRLWPVQSLETLALVPEPVSLWQALDACLAQKPAEMKWRHDETGNDSSVTFTWFPGHGLLTAPKITKG